MSLFLLIFYIPQFSHIGNPHINPESLTATMQKQVFNKEAAHQIDKRLPQMYKVREEVGEFVFAGLPHAFCD